MSAANWWDAQEPAAEASRVPVQPAYWPEAAKVAKPAPKPASAPREAKPGRIEARRAWLVFRSCEGADGMRDHCEHLRVAEDRALNRVRPGEPRDWDWDVPLMHHDDTDPQAAWQRFVLSWRFSPIELGAAMKAASVIQGLEHLARDAERYREACGLVEEDAA
jgi:hypothetical protein